MQWVGFGPGTLEKETPLLLVICSVQRRFFALKEKDHGDDGSRNEHGNHEYFSAGFFFQSLTIK